MIAGHNCDCVIECKSAPIQYHFYIHTIARSAMVLSVQCMIDVCFPNLYIDTFRNVKNQPVDRTRSVLLQCVYYCSNGEGMPTWQFSQKKLIFM